jgi:hypothetical protein
VIGSAGTLGGFSGGIGMKKKLLELENIHHRVTETQRKSMKNWKLLSDLDDSVVKSSLKEEME